MGGKKEEKGGEGEEWGRGGEGRRVTAGMVEVGG